ncbi:MAG: 2-hydroxychromene-2-carboxylate isomerase [Rhodobacteraceae bacterium]|nr:2-hydroxychromene-2-carboxylate isomerase [Paracoccaceae bacterium]
MRHIDVWLSIGSTYSYLTVSRMPALAAARGVTLAWHFFDVRAIMIEMKNIPFRDKPSKSAYMWRDMARRAARFGLHPRLPAPYPLSDLPRVNRVALVAQDEGWGETFLTAAYTVWFEEGREIAEPEALQTLLSAIGKDAHTVLVRADSDVMIAALDHNTDTARTKGIFGAPSLLVGDELFWGDDRVEEALDWALATSAPD